MQRLPELPGCGGCQAGEELGLGPGYGCVTPCRDGPALVGEPDVVHAPVLRIPCPLREFTHGHTLQLASVARAHLISLAERTDLLPGIEEQAYVDINSLLRPVYGHAKQGASFGHTKISGKQVLRKGLSPSATTISTRGSAPVAGIRLRAGKAGSNSDESTVEADLTHRRHAVIETVFADLIDGPLAHQPSGRFAANSAWAICAMITHNLLRAADTLDPNRPAARGATLRRQIVNVPARLARPQRRPVLHLPAHWPWADRWLTLWTAVFGQTKAPPQTV